MLERQVVTGDRLDEGEVPVAVGTILGRIASDSFSKTAAAPCGAWLLPVPRAFV